MSDDEDLFLVLLARVGASDAVMHAAREARTELNYVPIKPSVSEHV